MLVDLLERLGISEWRGARVAERPLELRELLRQPPMETRPWIGPLPVAS